MACAFCADGDHPGLSKHFEMVRQSRLGQIQTEFIARPLPLRRELNDPQTNRVAQRLEHIRKRQIRGQSFACGALEIFAGTPVHRNIIGVVRKKWKLDRNISCLFRGGGILYFDRSRKVEQMHPVFFKENR